MYTVINMCFKVSRYIESYYCYDDILAVNNDTTRTLKISDLFVWLDKLANEVKRDLKEKISSFNGSYPMEPTSRSSKNLLSSVRTRFLPNGGLQLGV